MDDRPETRAASALTVDPVRNNVAEPSGGGNAPAVAGGSAGWRLWEASRATRRGTLLLASLLAWQAAAATIDNAAFPTVPQFAAAVGDVVSAPVYWVSLGQTLVAWAIGLCAAALVGVPTGLLIGLNTVVDHATRVTVAALQAIPSIVLVPLLVLIYGTTMEMKVILVFIAAFWPLLMQASYGAREVDHVAKETARSYRFSRVDLARYLYLPSASAFVATGLRIAATIALLVTIGAEIVTSAPGIGLQIQLGESNGQPARAFVYFVTASLLGLLIATVFRRIERLALFWHPAHRTRQGR